MERKVTIKELVKTMELNVLAGEVGLDNIISDTEITFPWLELTGVFKYFQSDKINLIGSKEATYLKEIGEELAMERVKTLFEHTPCCLIFSLNVENGIVDAAMGVSDGTKITV